MLFVDLVGDAVEGVHGVEPHAALVAAPGLVGDQTEHLDLLDQVVPALVDVGEAVDLFPGQVGGRGHEVFMLRLQRQLVGLGRGVDVGNERRVRGHVLHPFPPVIDHVVQLLQTVDVILFGLDHPQTLPDC